MERAMAVGPDRRLPLAVSAAACEVLVQVALLVSRGVLGGAPLRIVFVLFKIPLLLLAWKRNPGGYLGLWLWEIGAVIAAITLRQSLGWHTRAFIAVPAIVVMVLLGRASSAYPTVEWRSR